MNITDETVQATINYLASRPEVQLYIKLMIETGKFKQDAVKANGDNQRDVEE